MSQSIIQRAFAAGELAPVLHSRADQVKYTTGLKSCRNFFVRREGGVSNRAGFRFVETSKTTVYGARLIRYVGSLAGESYLIEMGANYLRFFKNGAAVSVSGVAAYNGATAYVAGDLVTNGGTTFYAIIASTGVATSDTASWYPLPGSLYEIPTPWPLSQLPDWNQSGNVITLTHPAHQPRELVFIDAVHWTLKTIITSPVLAAPLGLVATPGAAGALPYRYIVTAASKDTYEETEGSAAVNCTCALPTQAAPNSITWTAIAAAAEYNVYCDPYGNGVFGFVGVAASNLFKDANVVPDFALTPPQIRLLFASSGNYPTTATRYQQRQWFANSDLNPDAVWGSRIGFRKNFGISSPLQDDDSITFRLAGNNQHAIRYMAALKAGLIVMTDGGEWAITGGGGPQTPVTPSSLNADQDTYAGIKPDVKPVVVGNAVLYVQARGTIVRDLQFSRQVDGLAGRDLTIFATHLFERKTIEALDYQQTPHSIIWCVSSDGTLQGLTYIPDQDIWGWHHHDTAGVFEDLCVVPELDEDVVYVLVKRTIGGTDRRYIERMERRELKEGFYNATSFFVDSGLSYSGAPGTHFAGLNHLEGQTVSVLADGVPSTAVVSVGAVNLSVAASNVHVGLPIAVAEIETLSLDVQGTALRDKKKRVASVTLLVERSSRGFYAGPDATRLTKFTPQTWEGSAVINTGGLELNITSTFNSDGRVLVRQTDPLPLTILGVIPNVEVGG